MVKNLTISGGQASPELIQLNKILKNLDVTRQQLVDLAIMVGTDFNQGIKGIGAKKGLKLIKKHGDIYHALEHLDVELDVDPDILRDMFLNHEVESHYQLKCRRPIQKKLWSSYAENMIFPKTGY